MLLLDVSVLYSRLNDLWQESQGLFKALNSFFSGEKRVSVVKSGGDLQNITCFKTIMVRWRYFLFSNIESKSCVTHFHPVNGLSRKSDIGLGPRPPLLVVDPAAPLTSCWNDAISWNQVTKLVTTLTNNKHHLPFINTVQRSLLNGLRS